MADGGGSKLRYGTDLLQLPAIPQAVTLATSPVTKEITPQLFGERLAANWADNPLDLSQPVLVLADKTRLCGYREYLPVLLAHLEQHGMQRSRLKVLIAYGTHPPQSEEECLQAYGDCYHRLSFTHHDCHDSELFTEVGRTRRHTPIRLRRDLLAASCVITMGAISHHYFAGYGGGRKLVFPGCGEREAIYANHALFLDQDKSTLAPGCRPGQLTGNPLAEDLFEVEDHLPAHLAIHGILDAYGQVCDLLVGRGRDHFLAACRQHGKSCEQVTTSYDLVVASCGGYPKDINFIQSHKAVHNAAMFVKDGGQLILYAECRDGIGSKTFLPWFEQGGFSQAFSRLTTNYQGNGGTALAMMSKTARIHISLVTSLEAELCNLIGATRVTHEQSIARLLSLPQGQNLAIIPNASLLVPRLTE